MRRRSGYFECALCGQTLFGITRMSRIRKVIVGTSGEENMRAVIVDEREIHRCPVSGKPLGATRPAV